MSDNMFKWYSVEDLIRTARYDESEFERLMSIPAFDWRDAAIHFEGPTFKRRPWWKFWK